MARTLKSRKKPQKQRHRCLDCAGDMDGNDPTRCRRCKKKKNLESKFKRQTPPYEFKEGELEEYLDTKECEICKVELTWNKEGKNRFCLDHDHETGRPRGVLCYKCNTGISKFSDDIDILNEAIRYFRVNEFHGMPERWMVATSFRGDTVKMRWSSGVGNSDDYSVIKAMIETFFFQMMDRFTDVDEGVMGFILRNIDFDSIRKRRDEFKKQQEKDK